MKLTVKYPEGMEDPDERWKLLQDIIRATDFNDYHFTNKEDFIELNESYKYIHLTDGSGNSALSNHHDDAISYKDFCKRCKYSYQRIYCGGE